MDLSWYELRCEYKESNKKIKNAKKELKDVFSAQAIADKEILGNMIGEGNKMMKVLNQKYCMSSAPFLKMNYRF